MVLDEDWTAALAAEHLGTLAGDAHCATLCASMRTAENRFDFKLEAHRSLIAICGLIGFPGGWSKVLWKTRVIFPLSQRAEQFSNTASVDNA